MTGIAWPWRRQSRRVAELHARATETPRRATSAKVEADRLARAYRPVPAERRERLPRPHLASATAEPGAGGHHAPLGGFAAHSKGPAAQGGSAQFFPRAEKGVQVEVQDGAGHGRFSYQL